jgi:hypothetical protein
MGPRLTDRRAIRISLGDNLRNSFGQVIDTRLQLVKDRTHIILRRVGPNRRGKLFDGRLNLFRLRNYVVLLVIFHYFIPRVP